jgi:hypothetical protein
MIALLATILIFPVSFGVYAFSQRMMAKHESRVGREISVGSFFAQTFSDARVTRSNTGFCLRFSVH